MSVLTENCVLSRTRAQDLKSVRKLNCWGSELEDVSIVRKMSHVEVLSLSVNNISTLADFAHCKNLQELYIRKNNIGDLNEVLYLKDLPKLKNLWLADNPCAESDNYRMTVLRHLPNLQKLDNQTVQSHEVERAQVQGAVLILPTLDTAAVEEKAPPTAPSSNHNNRQQSSVNQPSAKFSPPQAHQNGSEDGHHKYSNVSRPRELEVEMPATEANVPNRATAFQSPQVTSPLCKDPPRLAEAACSPVLPNMPQDGHASCQGMSPAEQHAFHARVQTLIDHSGRRLRKSAEITCDPVALFEGDDPAAARQSNAQLGDTRRFSSVEYLHTHSLESDALMSPPPADSSVRGGATMYAEVHRSHKAEKGSPTRLLPKGGKNRNANILSAVLCLIKELDYASLEVVETAIHCRMEEMDG